MRRGRETVLLKQGFIKWRIKRRQEEAGGADGSQQLGRKIRNASAIYVETQLTPYAPKWLPGACQHNQHFTVRARLYSGQTVDCFLIGGLTEVDVEMTLDTKLESIFNVCCYYSLVHTSSFQTNWCLFSLSAAAAASSGFQAVTC